MALRFQEFDDVDREVKEHVRRGERSIVVTLCLLAGLFGLVSWIRGESMASWERTFACLVGLFFAWLVFSTLSSLSIESTMRTKDICGTVSEIQKTVSAVTEDHKEILEKLRAIEEKLDSGETCLNRTSLNTAPTEQRFFPELTGVQYGLQRLDKLERENRDREKLDRIRERDRQ